MRAFLIVSGVVSLLLPIGGTANALDDPSSPAGLTAGEHGSGPAPWPVVEPRTPAPRSWFPWSDLDASHKWARDAINFVGRTNDWMRDFKANPDGSYPFKPDVLETRKYFARAAVRALAPSTKVDPRISFPDLEPSQSFYKWANIAVRLGWMQRLSGGRFMPDKPVTMTMVHRVLVHALGMKPVARQLDHLHTRDAHAFNTPANFGAILLGMRLGLRYNADDERKDVGPRTRLSRAQAAYSLWKATTLPGGTVSWVADQYARIVLPKLGPKRRAIVQWGVRFVGYPYVWGGEWGKDSPEPPALGGQPIPGFDCSGMTWWAMRANDGGYWKVAPPRPYAGWSLPQRTSADMARFGVVKYKRLLPGDLAFYDGDRDRRVDHVNVYIGNGYALDSSFTPGGVTLMWVGDGWYRQHFVHGRRVLRPR